MLVRRLRLCDHVNMKMQNMEVRGISGRGRPRKPWEYLMTADLCVKGL